MLKGACCGPLLWIAFSKCFYVSLIYLLTRVINYLLISLFIPSHSMGNSLHFFISSSYRWINTSPSGWLVIHPSIFPFTHLLMCPYIRLSIIYLRIPHYFGRKGHVSWQHRQKILPPPPAAKEELLLSFSFCDQELVSFFTSFFWLLPW